MSDIKLNRLIEDCSICDEPVLADMLTRHMAEHLKIDGFWIRFPVKQQSDPFERIRCEKSLQTTT